VQQENTSKKTAGVERRVCIGKSTHGSRLGVFGDGEHLSDCSEYQLWCQEASFCLFREVYPLVANSDTSILVAAVHTESLCADLSRVSLAFSSLTSEPVAVSTKIIR